MDFQRLQALNLVLHSSASGSPPSTPVEGEPWWVTDTDVLKIYNGTAWNTVVVGPASSTSGRIPQWSGTSGGILQDGLDLVTTVGGTGSDTAVPTEQAVREAIAAAMVSDVSFMGGYNAATNSPDLDTTPIATAAGDMYYVTAAGTFFTEALEIGDVLIANQINATALAHWTLIQKNLPNIIPVANGGTGLATTTAYALIAAGTTATGNFQQLPIGTQYQVLFAGTAAALPTWSPYTMPSTIAQYAMLYASTTAAISALANGATTGTFLRNTNGAVPAWSALVLPNALVQWGMLYAGTADNYTGVIAAAGTTGTFLRGTASGAPAWSTLVLPNASAVGDLIQGTTSANNMAVLSSVSAGSYLRSGGVTTVSAWSTVKLPDTMSALGIWVANTANTVVNLTVTALQSIRMNAGGNAWEAYTPGGGSAHNILDGSTHSDSAAATVVRGAMIVGNATPKWDLLAFQASGVSGYVLASDATDAGWKKGRYVEKLSTSATSYDVVHNLGTRRVHVTCQDTTNNQNILVDWACKSGAENTTITVSFGVAPSANTRIITVFGVNHGNALDTAN